MNKPLLPPDHMDRASRTQRLYDHLKGMGLVVSPIYVNGEIDSLHVAVDLPRCTAQQATESGVILPMQGADVGGGIEPAQERRLNVVYFPPYISLTPQMTNCSDGPDRAADFTGCAITPQMEEAGEEALLVRYHEILYPSDTAVFREVARAIFVAMTGANLKFDPR